MTLRLLLILFAIAGEASAQTAPALNPAGHALTADVLRDLPNGANLFAILETMQPEIIADGFHSGGLNGGTPASLGAFLASPRQTRYRVADLDLSSPVDGTPLLFPHLMPWERTDVLTGLMPLDRSAPGLVIELAPRRAAAQWQGLVEASAASGILITAPDASRPPPVSRLNSWTHVSTAIEGPVLDNRMGLALGATWLRSATRDREEPVPRVNEHSSVFAHTNFALNPGTDLRTFVWVERADGTSRSAAVHLQSTLERVAADQAVKTSWRLVGGYTRKHTDKTFSVSNVLTVDRLVDGPFSQWLPTPDRGEHRASIGAHALTGIRSGRHRLAVGGTLEHVGASEGEGFSGEIRETVDGIPARVWNVITPPTDSRRSATALTTYIEDRIALSSQVTLDAGVAFDFVRGRAVGSSSDVLWRSLLPRLALHWRPGTPYDLGLFAGYRRAANNLRLDLLAYGDPAAPGADVYRWDGIEPSTSDPLIARVGPGTRGDDDFSVIDPDLKRPITDEFVIGFEARPRSSVRLVAAGIARRQTPLVHVVNTGVPATDYESFTIPDDNVDLIGTADDQELTVFNRAPASFGRDRFLLTNPEVDAATMGAFVIAAEATTGRLWLRAGATASASVGSGGARGFRGSENDQDILGEGFANPNAQTFARGRLFVDRAYVIKWTTIYRFPSRITLGAIARYQDGQPFSRMVIVQGLNQGVEAIQAFPNGRSRFAFRGTLDIRVQKGFDLGGPQLDLIFDAYNVLNMTKEVEEYVVTGDRYRTTTYVQPAPVIHLGFRLRL